MRLTPEEQAAHEQLRARQGRGARTDSAGAPASDLLLARRGTAYFARKLNELADTELDGPSLREEWSRRHLIAHIGYHARALAHALEGVRTGTAQAPPTSAEAGDAERDLGATLPARALRHLFHHAAVHLDVEWRDLRDADWDVKVLPFAGAPVPARATPLLRAREVWLAGVALGNGGRIEDVPQELRNAA